MDLTDHPESDGTGTHEYIVWRMVEPDETTNKVTITMTAPHGTATETFYLSDIWDSLAGEGS